MIEELKFYATLLWRRLPMMIVLVALATALGAVVATRLPPVYSTNATLLVENPQIPDRLVGVTFGVGGNEQLAIVQRRLMTRANLLEVARATQALPNIRQMTPDEIVSAMRDQTRIGRARGKNAEAVMTVGFEGQNPQRVAEVVNQYVTIILATSTDIRAVRAQGTLDFFQQEADQLAENLDLQSQKIVTFKNENANALPENLNYRLSRESLLQERLGRIERDLETLRAQEANVLRIYEATGDVRPQATAALTPDQRNLQALEQELNAALSVFSEQNPKVRLLRNRIAALKARIEGQIVDASDVVVEPQSASATALEISLSEIKTREEALSAEANTIREELQGLRVSIEATPLNRISIEAMERELENLRALHSSAVQRLNQARMGERVEVAAKGERITLLEPANVPDSPSSPNRMLIIGGAAGVGFALALAFFVLLELINQSIRRPADIERKLQISPLATLPLIETSLHRRARRFKKLATLVVVCATIGGGIWAIDTYYMRIDQLIERVLRIIA